MVISPEFVAMLRCPETRTPLQMADSGLIQRLNKQIAAKQLTNRGGQTLETPLDGGLIRQDAAVLYPIVHGIPILLVDDGIALEPDGST